MTRADCADAVGSPPEFCKREIGPKYTSRLPNTTYQNSLAEGCSDVDISDARIDVNPHGLSLVDKDLFQQSTVDLTRVDKRVRNKVPLWPVGTRPTDPESSFFRCTRLNDYVSGARDFGLYSPAKSLAQAN